jgi:hypothetical protein
MHVQWGVPQFVMLVRIVLAVRFYGYYYAKSERASKKVAGKEGAAARPPHSRGGSHAG